MSEIRIEYPSIVSVLGFKVVLFCNGKQQWVNAKWDTGATRSSIPEIAASFFGLESIGECPCSDSSGVSARNWYRINISLSDDICFMEHKVIGSHIDKQGLGLLIGMDIISQGNLTIKNNDGKTTLVFSMDSPNK